MRIFLLVVPLLVGCASEPLSEQPIVGDPQEAPPLGEVPSEEDFVEEPPREQLPFDPSAIFDIADAWEGGGRS